MVGEPIDGISIGQTLDDDIDDLLEELVVLLDEVAHDGACRDTLAWEIGRIGARFVGLAIASRGRWVE
jgi:hypothetical protein